MVGMVKYAVGAVVGALAVTGVGAIAVASGVTGSIPGLAAAPAAGGPALAGICVLSRDLAIANSVVGKAATARLKVISEEAQKEVDGQKQALQASIRALDAQRGSLPADKLEAQSRGLNEKLRGLQALADQRSLEIEGTRRAALTRIAVEAQPLITEVYQARKCGLLLERSAVLAGNAELDVTKDVIARLDAGIKPFNFDREKLEAKPKPKS